MPPSDKELRERQNLVKDFMLQGFRREEAAQRAGIRPATVAAWWARNTQGFRDWVEALRNTQPATVRARVVEDGGRREDGAPIAVPDFREFRRDYIGLETPRHQWEWIQSFEHSDRVLILQPPRHGKTTTLEDYITWRIVKDRGIRCVFVSKSQDVAKKRLARIQKHLVDHSYFIRNGLNSIPGTWGPFQPAGAGGGAWSASMFYVSGIDTTERDPTCEALGIGNQIYGAGADLIILDDVATLKNMTSPVEKAKIMDWISQEVETRLPPEGGKIIIIGTRVHEQDIYAHFLEGGEDWTQDYDVICQPAVTSDAQKKVLWPEVWTYERLMDKRKRVMPRTWALVYQQQASGMPDAPFSPEAVELAKDPTYDVGQFTEGLIPVMGVDPALTGTMAIVVLGLDRDTGVRYVLDVIAESPRNPGPLKARVVETAARYRVVECRIEKNAMQGLLSRDEEFEAALRLVGCRLIEEYTHQGNKYDPEWGIGLVAAGFDSRKYRIPWANGINRRKMQAYVDELLSWRPRAKMKQDRVMATWLAELSARNIEYTGQVRLARDSRVPRWYLRRRALLGG